MNEFAIEWERGDAFAWVTVPNHTKLKSKLVKYSKSYPEEVTVVKENKDGSLLAKVPVSYIKVSPPKRMSAENREKASERMKKLHQSDED